MAYPPPPLKFGNQVQINSYYGGIVTDTDSATITLDFFLSNAHSIILGGNRTLVASNDSVGQLLTVIIQQPASGGPYSPTWWTGITWSGGTQPTSSTAANAIDVYSFLKTGTGTYIGNLSSTSSTVSPPSTLSGNNTFTGLNTFSVSTATTKGMIIQLAASQSADAFEIQNNTGTTITDFDSKGNLTINAPGISSCGILVSSNVIVSNYGGVWIGQSSPDNTNYSLLGNNTQTIFNNKTQLIFRAGNITGFIIDANSTVPRSIFGYLPTSSTGDTNAVVSIVPSNTLRKGLIIEANTSQTGNLFEIQNSSANAVTFSTAKNSFVLGNAALSTSATDGFLYLPTCAGAPTGTPTTQTGTAPCIVDTTDNALYFYSGSAWNQAGGSGGGSSTNGPAILATVTGISGTSVAGTTLYTVPTVGKNLIIMGCIIRCTQAISISAGPTCGLGTSSGSNNIFSAAATSVTNVFKIYNLILNGSGTIAGPGSTIVFNVSTAATGPVQTLAVDLIGYLI